MNKVSDRLAGLSESQTLAMAQKSRELQEQGKDIINLSIGEPDFNTPTPIKEAAIQAINDNYSHYTPVPGFKELREAISGKFKRENDLNYSADQIVVSAGAKHSITNVILSLVNPDEEVIIPAPYWVSYIEIVKLAGAKPVSIPAGINSNFKITPEQLEAAITPKTRAFLFSSPSNPTGSLYTKEELKAFADVFAKHKDIIVLSDEIYEHINFSGKHESIAQFENIKDQIIVINGVSKGYAMTGWRIGYIAAPLWIAKACTKLQGQMTSGVCAVAQKAAEAALKGSCDSIIEMREKFRQRRDLVLDLLKDIPGVKVNKPDGAFYIFADMSSFIGKSYNNLTINNTNDLSMYILNEGLVATVCGEAFGSPGYIRFSYATSEKILENAISRMKSCLAKLK